MFQIRAVVLSLAIGGISLGVAKPLQAGQPIHESLVECAVLVELLIGEQTPVPGQNKMLDFYTRAAHLMRTEAARQRDMAYVAETSRVKRAAWHQRWDENGWDEPENREELVEWFTYCMKLGQHLKLPL
ncbi:hypothetical protein PEL8287_00100 [Roseovarius litorisediminis]|uniref:Uncharacterized protein n=1 Tax=Roseovarius litorisediminis TaxID=1312363 RepID=A0A1Y5R5T2_9RHOB|nr:hypothetical protein [Roseovarius litorisediminis]SLN09775.1 hypothetical protein PEL8287_00100 [Roseovarius litorisediminis]